MALCRDEALKSMGRWNVAIVRCVFFSSLVFLLFAISTIDDWSYGLYDDLFKTIPEIWILLFCYFWYFFGSLFAWVIIGLPLHWMICKCSGGELFWYLCIGGIFCVVVGLVFPIEFTLVCCFFVFLQIMIFKYNVNRMRTT